VDGRLSILFGFTSESHGRADTEPDLKAMTTMNQTIASVEVDQLKPEVNSPSDGQRILDATGAILAQGEQLLQGLKLDAYTRKSPDVFGASISGHYRHCLDHFTSVLRALDAEEVDYDDRDRDSRIESSPDFALVITRQLRVGFERWSPAVLDTPVKARCEISYTHGEAPVTSSCLGRELVYCIAHAIHHYALIWVMARLMNVSLPEHFGVAPSTVAYLESTRREDIPLR
jgi:hypothetical protein